MKQVQLIILFNLLAFGSPKVAPKHPAPPGVKEPGIQRPIANLRPESVIAIEGTPDWIAVAPDSVWISNMSKNSVSRIDPKTNKVSAVVEVGKKPCAGLAVGFGA